MQSTDTVLVQQAQNGDSDAIATLYDTYITDIYRFVRFKTQSDAIAEDLTSNIFLKVVEKISTVDTARGSFRAWLYQLTRNTIIDHYRTKKDTESIYDAWDLSANPRQTIDEKIDVSFFSEEVESALRELSADQRDIIIMRIWHDMSYKEIALVLDKSSASCRMAYSRGITALQETCSFSIIISLLLV